jgi:hypothetical protein
MRKTLFTLLLVGAGCATTGGGGPSDRVRQASHKLPLAREIEDDAERALFEDAMKHASLAEVAKDSGNKDQACSEWRAAGLGLGQLADKYRNSDLRLVYRSYGARLLIQGGDHEAAVQVAEALRADPAASPASRAYGLQLRAGASQSLANAEVKAGRLEPLRIVGADKRKGQEPKPRPLPETWRRFVAAADDYGAAWKDDESPNARQLAAAFAVQAAQVHFSFDNMEEANRRLEAAMEAFAATALLPDAASLYLQTYLVRRDEAGYAAALDRTRSVVAAEARRAAEAARGSTDADLKGRAEQLAKLDEELLRQRQGMGFKLASALLAESQKLEGEPGRLRSVEAATAFERFAAENPGHPDAASALYNAAIAWGRAKEPRKALADREAVMSRYPDSRLAPKALLAVASDLSAAGDHAGAAQRYGQYLERHGAGEDRCLALQNVGAELDAAKQPVEAARRYLEFGTDPKCSREDPNSAVKVLYRAAALHTKAGRKAEAGEALRALVAVPGVTDPVARSYVDDARARTKK